MKAGEVIEALRRSYAPRKGWVTVAEVRIGTGFGGNFRDHPELIGALEQRIDLFAYQTWPSGKFERLAFEVKVSRSDFLHEVATPGKRKAATYLAHRFLFATPKGLVQEGEIPDGCGLVEVDGRGCVETLAGVRNDAPPLPETFVASLLRVASEQRSIDRRCGFNGCGGSAYRYPVLLNVGKVPMCETHLTRWHERKRQQRVRQQRLELAGGQA